jgi:phosphatidylserine/phosphatidylglycerophosphate/cardiolipin synthase-like enzyme
MLKAAQADQINDFPNYHVFNPVALIGSSIPKEFYVGTGFSIFSRALLPAILDARHHVHFVTCYWADSPSLDAFRGTLEELARMRKEQGTVQPLKITIGFSSRGLFQKLFHTASRDGYVYPPSQWCKLGLPDEGLLKAARIDMTVKSLFFTPFSVMHPKYLVIDNKKAWVPSCNVSWERWFEGCIALEGDIVAKITTFHEKVWGSGTWSAFGDGQTTASDGSSEMPCPRHPPPTQPTEAASATQSCNISDDQPVPTIFLPSPHHRNPRFRIFPLLSQSQPPITPLNAALLTLFETAEHQITILTPNVTSWPAIDALLAALARGVDVQIRTSKDMMFIEQLVTAGTWTSRCLKQLVQRYEKMRDESRTSRDLEASSARHGHLEILFYKEASTRAGQVDEPVVSHFKATMVDSKFVILGSGNMDRASWWTSQEIGLLFYMPQFEGSTLWESVLETRTEIFYTTRHG